MGLGGISFWQLPIVLVFIVASTAIVIVPFWFIYKKAGFSPWLSLLMPLPVANLVMFFFLAFASWPALEKERE